VSSPFAFAAHPVWLAAVLITGTLYAVAVRRPGWHATGGQVGCFCGGLAALAVAGAWPLGDLAAHWSLTALVVQRLILVLCVPALLLLGTPQPLLGALTRPAPVDAVVRTCSRPVVAVAVVTVAAVSTLSTAAVSAQASSAAARGALTLVLVGTGFVLWLPVLGRFPGAPRLSPVGKAAYLMVQSVVPSFLAVVWIFARHPLYRSFVHRHGVAGLAPLTDQQLAGFAAKLGTIAVLWTVAFVILTRGERAGDVGEDHEPLTWADVERHLERAERRERRRRVWLPDLGERTDGGPPPGGDPGA